LTRFREAKLPPNTAAKRRMCSFREAETGDKYNIAMAFTGIRLFHH